MMMPEVVVVCLIIHFSCSERFVFSGSSRLNAVFASHPPSPFLEVREKSNFCSEDTLYMADHRLFIPENSGIK